MSPAALRQAGWWGGLFAACGLWLGVSTAPLGAPIAVDANVAHMDLSADLRLLNDPGGRLGADEVDRSTAAFRSFDRDDLLRKYRTGAFWLSLSLINVGPTSVTRWLAVGSPRLESVQLYERQGEGWRHMRSGSSVPQNDRPIAAEVPVFPLTLRAGERQDYLLRVQSTTVVQMDTVLWEPEAYREHAGEHHLLAGMVLGGTLLAAIASFFVFALLKEPPWFYYGLFQLAAAVLVAIREGLLQRYAWPHDLPHYTPLLTLFAGLALFSMTRFVETFLEARTRFPRWSMTLTGLRWVIAVTVAISMVDYSIGVRIATFVSIAVMISCVWISVNAWRGGYQPARFLILGFSTTWLMESARQFSNLGLVRFHPAMDFSLSTSFIVATPVILLALTERAQGLMLDLAASRQLSQAKSDFLTRVSHELRSPLNVIIGYARMLGRSSSRLPLQEGAVGIERSGLRVLGLIDELLDQSRLDAGQLPLSPRPLLLSPWLSELAAAARVQALAAENSFVFEREGKLPLAVIADGERLYQVLDNLLTNANRHTQRGSIRLVCRCTGVDASVVDATGNAALYFAVIDSGTGIARKDQDRIFEPFVQLEAATRPRDKRRAGIGMGLSIARELVGLMGGDLTVTSEPGVGSTFSFTVQIPLAAGVAAEPVAEGSAAELVPDPAGPGSGPRLLLVEDDGEARLALAAQLCSFGFVVDEAESGAAAVRRLETVRDRPGHYAAVVTDQLMEDGDGWFVLRTVREAEPDLPVLLLSAVEPFRPHDFPAGLNFDATLRKPVSPEILLTTLWALVAMEEKDAARADDGDAEVAEVVTRPVPAQAQLLELIALAQAGEVSGIEEWIERLSATSPQCEAFGAEAHRCLRELDLAALESIARSAMLG